MRRLAFAVLAALAFGIVASAVKGNGAGARDALGNLSAPWLIAPVLTASYVLAPMRTSVAARIAAGAAIGLLTTFVALLGFYATNSVVLDLGTHSSIANLGLTLPGGAIWAKLGLLSGPVMGAAGGLMAGRRETTAIVAALLLLEPACVVAAHTVTSGRLGTLDGSFALVAALEVATGLAVAATWRRRRSYRP